VEEEPPDRLEDNPDAGHREQGRLDERGEMLDLPVSKRMRWIGGLVRYPHGEVRDCRSQEIQSRVRGFREDAKAPRQHTDDYLERRQRRRGDQRAQGHRLFFRSRRVRRAGWSGYHTHMLPQNLHKTLTAAPPTRRINADVPR